MQICNALVHTLNQGFVKKDIYIENGVFVDDVRIGDNEILDAAGCYLIPGLVDVHFHGCAGYDFSDATEEALERIGEYELSNGVTSICPASMTLPEDRLDKICRNALKYATSDSNGRARLCGVHLEGPFVSIEKKGAQNPQYIKKPDIEMFERLQEAAGGLIKLITLAPELDGAEAFIKNLSGKVHISVGHTMADYSTSSAAFEMGADHVTHMYNAMPPVNHRESGVVGAAFDNSHVMTELICDGIHISAPVIRMTFSMFGADRIVLISDSMMATGMDDGEYSLGGLSVKVRGNLATLKDGVIAGSATNLMDCMKKAVSIGIPLEDVVKCASYNPARSIGMGNSIGSIDVGKKADCVLLSAVDLSIKAVILDGEVVRKE
ncbi:N-acetylglucosamine-6-phosphate deacetylase [Lachnospiraceae bacterium KH1T2]|nr:N-acetylglucosamine-6-phosphate deacetylase [Lachnospiraceae bacterium KH1T2]